METRFGVEIGGGIAGMGFGDYHLQWLDERLLIADYLPEVFGRFSDSMSQGDGYSDSESRSWSYLAIY